MGPQEVNVGAAALIALVVGAVLSGGGYLFFIGWTKFHVSWLPLAGVVTAGAVYASATPGLESAKLAAAFNETRAALLARTKWTPEQLSRCMARAHIYVRDTKSWMTDDEQHVAGIQLGDVMHVGSDLAALLHETAHMCQELVDNRLDPSHESWAGLGIWAANDDFMLWLVQLNSSGEK